MANLPVITGAYFGHIGPALPAARKLAERGHTMACHTGQAFQTKVEATDARFVPTKATPHSDTFRPKAGIQTRKPKGLGHVKAARIQLDLSQHDTPTKAAVLLEQLATTEKSVLRVAW